MRLGAHMKTRAVVLPPMEAGNANTADVERRTTRRFASTVPVHTTDPSQGTVIGLTRDLSLGGIYFYVENGLWREGSSIEYVIQLPEGLTLTDAMWVMCFGTIYRIDRVGTRLGIAAKVECIEVLDRH